MTKKCVLAQYYYYFPFTLIIVHMRIRLSRDLPGPHRNFASVYVRRYRLYTYETLQNSSETYQQLYAHLFLYFVRSVILSTVRRTFGLKLCRNAKFCNLRWPPTPAPALALTTIIRNCLYNHWYATILIQTQRFHSNPVVLNIFCSRIFYSVGQLHKISAG